MYFAKKRLQLTLQHLRSSHNFQMKSSFSSTVPAQVPAALTVHLKKNQSIRHVILDKPKALNSLDLNMIYNITPQLLAW